MLHDFELGVEFFSWLTEADRRLAWWVQAEGCQRCGGPLHQGNYRRKPRGATLATRAVASPKFGPQRPSWSHQTCRQNETERSERKHHVVL